MNEQKYQWHSIMSLQFCGEYMNANMFQGEVQPEKVVGGPVRALKQGSVGPVLSDLQRMQQDERKQHEQAYIYEHGHNDGSAPLGKPSF